MKYASKNNYIVDNKYFVFTPGHPEAFNNGIVVYIYSKNIPELPHTNKAFITLIDAGDVIAAVVYKRLKSFFRAPHIGYNRDYNFDPNNKRSLYETIEDIKRRYLADRYLKRFNPLTGNDDIGYCAYNDPYLSFIKELLTNDSINNRYTRELIMDLGCIGPYKVMDNREEFMRFAIGSLQIKFARAGYSMYRVPAFYPNRSELVHSFYLACLQEVPLLFEGDVGFIHDNYGLYPTLKTVMDIYMKRYNRYRVKVFGMKDATSLSPHTSMYKDIITVELDRHG
jgi:hypothetical protein